MECGREAVIVFSCISIEEPTRLVVSYKLKVAQWSWSNSMGLKMNSKVTNVRLVKTCVGPGVRVANKGERELKVYRVLL